MTLSVVYLARKSNHPRWMSYFLKSLKKYPPGIKYDLNVICKGYEKGEAPAELKNFAAPDLINVTLHFTDDSTFATNAFFEIAKHIENEVLIFFVSWSRVLAPHWGKIMLDGLHRPDVGIIGASSGYEKLNEENDFPNCSIRTTGFCIRRDLWLSLEFGPLTRKYDGNLFEAGPNGMTKQIMARGLLALVAGRDGKYFDVNEWPNSRTFRSGNQENLLFSDNRTNDYDVGSNRRRKRLARLNWGDRAVVSPTNLVRRVYRKICWSLGF